MHVWELKPSEPGTSGLFETREGAKESAQRQLDEWNRLNVQEAEADDDWWYPIAVEVTWEPGTDRFGNWHWYATYCNNWWDENPHDRFILRKVEVGS